jgi:hypothetical protein
MTLVRTKPNITASTHRSTKRLINLPLRGVRSCPDLSMMAPISLGLDEVSAAVNLNVHDRCVELNTFRTF